jgi:hypothetical protein
MGDLVFRSKNLIGRIARRIILCIKHPHTDTFVFDLVMDGMGFCP